MRPQMCAYNFWRKKPNSTLMSNMYAASTFSPIHDSYIILQYMKGVNLIITNISDVSWIIHTFMS